MKTPYYLGSRTGTLSAGAIKYNRKVTGGQKFIKSLEKINHNMYKENIKLFTKNEK